MCIFFFTLYLLYHLLFPLKRTSARYYLYYVQCFIFRPRFSFMFPLFRDFVLNFPKESVRCTPICIIFFFLSFSSSFFFNVLTLTRTPAQSSKHTCVFRTCVYRRSLARLQFCFLFFLFTRVLLLHFITLAVSRTTELAGTPSVPCLCSVYVCVCIACVIVYQYCV